MSLHHIRKSQPCILASHRRRRVRVVLSPRIFYLLGKLKKIGWQRITPVVYSHHGDQAGTDAIMKSWKSRGCGKRASRWIPTLSSPHGPRFLSSRKLSETRSDWLAYVRREIPRRAPFFLFASGRVGLSLQGRRRARSRR